MVSDLATTILCRDLVCTVLSDISCNCQVQRNKNLGSGTLHTGSFYLIRGPVTSFHSHATPQNTGNISSVERQDAAIDTIDMSTASDIIPGILFPSDEIVTVGETAFLKQDINLSISHFDARANPIVKRASERTFVIDHES